jgi:hypothetical protein
VNHFRRFRLGIEDVKAQEAMGVIQDVGRVLSGPVSSIISQTTPSGGGSSWLKWLNPIAGLVSLFTGQGNEEQPESGPTLSPRLPKRRVEYGLVASEGGALQAADTDERGRIRLSDARSAAPSQIVVQVQTMDSRSFLDNRDDIASAVRQALMESHSLGTVLREFQE